MHTKHEICSILFIRNSTADTRGSMFTPGISFYSIPRWRHRRHLSASFRLLTLKYPRTSDFGGWLALPLSLGSQRTAISLGDDRRLPEVRDMTLPCHIWWIIHHAPFHLTVILVLCGPTWDEGGWILGDPDYLLFHLSLPESPSLLPLLFLWRFHLHQSFICSYFELRSLFHLFHLYQLSLFLFF